MKKRKGLANGVRRKRERNPKKTPTRARNPEKGKNEEMRRKGEEYRNAEM